MALPEYVAPILATGGPVAFAVVVLRFVPDALLRLLAGAVAVLTKDDKRGARCLEVLRLLRGKDVPPPSCQAASSDPSSSSPWRLHVPKQGPGPSQDPLPRSR